MQTFLPYPNFKQSVALKLITNQYISCLLVRKENHSKNCEILYCDIYDENFGKY